VYSLTDGTLTVESQTKVGGLPALETKEILFKSKDGTLVRGFLLYRKDLANQRKPIAAYGYGAYGAAELPGFRPEAAVLAEAGAVYVSLQVRGGGEQRGWHDGIAGLGKMKSYEDFIAGVEAVSAQGHGIPGSAMALGVSMGGELVLGAGLLAPQDFSAIIPDAPLADVVRTHLIALGDWSADEVGVHPGTRYGYAEVSPLEFARSADPQTHLPFMFLTNSENDQVLPSHPEKMTATLQARGERARFGNFGNAFFWQEAGMGHYHNSLPRMALRLAVGLQAAGLTDLSPRSQ
jgi:prolyl oligopeptidase